ncbi:MAG: cell division protein FtsQ/DivIB, partial [Candidatus Omnitrophica bacterium]|nr:cell division protein FtsQ/DivIB [Candidatus Omnitrophota bacterium]
EEEIRIEQETVEICNFFQIDPLQLISSGALLISAKPEYAEIIIKRVLPHRLWVVLKERLPIMQIKMGKFYPVDREGFILPYARETPHTNLPIILGIEPGEIAINSLSHSPRIRKAIEIIALIKEGKYFWEKGVTKINLTSLNDISFFLDNGIEVKFGSPVLKEKFERLSLVLEEVKIKSLSPSFIDLRFKDVILGPQ